MPLGKRLNRAACLSLVLAGLLSPAGAHIAEPQTAPAKGRRPDHSQMTSQRAVEIPGSPLLSGLLAEQEASSADEASSCAKPAFRVQPSFPAASAPLSLVTLDLNGDGKLDLAVPDSGANRVFILLGSGNGSFSIYKSIHVGGRPVFITAGEFNGDGKPDLVTANARPFTDDPGDISILLGDGSGGFTAKPPMLTADVPSSIAVGDYNGDGRADLAVANSGDGSISIFEGDGTGQFPAMRRLNVGGSPASLKAADFNHDGKLDLVLLTGVYGPAFLPVLLGNGDGTFRTAKRLNAGNAAVALAVDDFNNDRNLDLAVTSDFGSVSVFLGDGAGGFAPRKNSDVGPAAGAIATGDFNRDGKTDLVVTIIEYNMVTVLLGDGSGAFLPTTFYSTGVNSNSVVVGNFNGDQRPDFVVASVSESVTTYLGYGTGRFRAVTVFRVGIEPLSVAVADFNKDGKSDLVTADVTNISGYKPTLSVLFGDGTGNFAAAKKYLGTGNPLQVAVGDFNNDTWPDLAVADGTLSIRLNDGTGNFGAARHFSEEFDFYNYLAIGDFNNDHKADVALIGPSTDVAIFLGDGRGNFAPPAYSVVGQGATRIAVGDFNNDDNTDLAVTKNATFGSPDLVAVKLGDGTGSFGPPVDYPLGVGFSPQSITVADFNNDHKPDLATANGGHYSVSVLLGDGMGGFGARTNFRVGRGPRDIVSADFNRDGQLDLATANNGAGNVSVLLGTGTGSFGAPTNFRPAYSLNDVGWSFSSIAAGKINGDSQPDLVVTNVTDCCSPGTVLVMLNDCLPPPGASLGPDGD